MQTDLGTDALQVLLIQPVVYEATLIAVGVTVGLATYLGLAKWGMPWWEAKAMRASREKETNKTVASHVWWTIKNMVNDGLLSVDEGVTYVTRFANCVPLPEILPGGLKNLKQQLQDKHPQPTEVGQEEETPKMLSVLARLSAEKRAKATA